MTNRKIAVIGATGFLGTPVAMMLHHAGFEVTALIRDEKKSHKLPQAIRKIKGDLWNAGDLDNLLKGQDALYLNLNVERSARQSDKHTEREGLRIILDAASRHHIKRIGFLSSLVMNYQGMNNFHWWVFDLKKKAVDLVKSTAIPSTIFYPSSFMDNFESTYRMGNRILLAGTSRYKMYFIAASDFGRQVARAFEDGSNEHKEYIIQGEKGFTADEAAAVYIQHHPDKALKISRAPLPLLKFLGRFSNEMNYGYHIIEALNNYPEQFGATQTWQALDRPSITLEKFASGMS